MHMFQVPNDDVDYINNGMGIFVRWVHSRILKISRLTACNKQTYIEHLCSLKKTLHIHIWYIFHKIFWIHLGGIKQNVWKRFLCYLFAEKLVGTTKVPRFEMKLTNHIECSGRRNSSMSLLGQLDIFGVRGGAIIIANFEHKWYCHAQMVLPCPKLVWYTSSYKCRFFCVLFDYFSNKLILRIARLEKCLILWIVPLRRLI